MSTKAQNRKAAAEMDPQCGKTIDAEKAWKLNWEGKTYLFCSEECRAQFELDPPGVAGF